MIEFIKSNYEWLFSGAGISLISWLLGHRQGYNKAIKQNMKVGNNSTAIQVGGNMSGNIEKD